MFQLDTSLCFRRAHACYQMDARECVFRVHVYICVCTCTHMCVSRVHRRVFTCTHFCLPTRRVLVFQENTCLLLDEYSCVSVFLRAHKCVCVCVHACSTHVCVPLCTCVCAHLCACVSPTCTQRCVFTCAHMCGFIRHVYVFQVNTCLFSAEHPCVCSTCTHVCSRVRTCVFQLDTCLRSMRTHGCHRMSALACVPGAPLCECSRSSRVHICVFTCTHMCVPLVRTCVFHLDTCLCSRWTDVCST